MGSTSTKEAEPLQPAVPIEGNASPPHRVVTHTASKGYRPAHLQASGNGIERRSNAVMDVNQDVRAFSSRSTAATSCPPRGKDTATSLKPRQAGHEPSNQIFQRRLETARKKYCELEIEHEKVVSQCRREEGYNIQLNKDLEKMSEENRAMLKEYERLEHKNTELLQQYNDLQQKYNKKVENYKELDRNYMALVRPLLVTKDDPSTIYNRLVQITVSIEHLIQKAKGGRSINLRREAVIENFQRYRLFQVFPEEALLDPYHLNLFMESVVMTLLCYRLFSRPLGCIFEQSEEFEGIRKWVDERDPKMATRWRQQLCILVAQDVDAMAQKREEEASAAAQALTQVISTIYSNVDMSAKIEELCYNTFDLSLAMFGMESMIYPVPIRLGIPFDNENMTTPQKSNPEGSVSLVIFPAFQDDSKNFYYKPKVWCY